MANQPIYLDNNSTTQVDPAVLERMLPFLTVNYGNASSVTHIYGQIAAKAVSTAREQVATLLKCESKAIVFTSGATESNNIAIQGVMRSASKGRHLIVNAAEHKAVLDPAYRLAKEGYEVTILPVDRYGKVSVEEVSRAIRSDTALVSVMHANNEVGTINPVFEIAKVCKKHGVLFHTDATQTVGKVEIDLSSGLIDLLSLSAHKFYGPKGIGALYVRPGYPRIKIEPLFEGGGHERRLRSGTLPVHQIVGLGAACDIASEKLTHEANLLTQLRDRLRSNLIGRIPDIVFNGDESLRLPGNLHVSIPGVNSEALMMNLRDYLAISSGSACTTLSPQPSHVLTAMGVTPSLISSSIRFGIGRFNTIHDIDEAGNRVGQMTATLRQLRSP
jgi:cysteine desulfurase